MGGGLGGGGTKRLREEPHPVPGRPGFLGASAVLNTHHLFSAKRAETHCMCLAPR